MEEGKITKRHQRLLSSLFFVLEQKIESIEHMINHTPQNATYVIEQDLEEYEIQTLREVCVKLKGTIQQVAGELELPRRKISQRHYISTIQSQMWENITDAFSDKLKGYGKAVVEGGKHADPHVQQIADEIDKLRV